MQTCLSANQSAYYLSYYINNYNVYNCASRHESQFVTELYTTMDSWLLQKSSTKKLIEKLELKAGYQAIK